MVLVVHHHLGQSSLDFFRNLILLILWCLWCTIHHLGQSSLDFFQFNLKKIYGACGAPSLGPKFP
jgi:hypothetical protein